MVDRYVKTHEGQHRSPANKLVGDSAPELARMTLRSESFDLDNGAGTTVDRALGRLPHPAKLLAARIVYDDATSGTVAAGNMRLGTTVGGSELMASTAYENAKAVGTQTAGVLTAAAALVAAGTPILARHTGVAATQAGRAVVEVDYMLL